MYYSTSEKIPRESQEKEQNTIEKTMSNINLYSDIDIYDIITKERISLYKEMHKYICENIIDLGTDAEDFFANSWFIETTIATLKPDRFDGIVRDEKEHGHAHFHITPIFKNTKGKIKKMKAIKQDKKNNNNDDDNDEYKIKVFITLEIPQTADDIRYDKDSPYKLNNEVKEAIANWAKEPYEERETKKENNNTYKCIIPIEKGKIRTNWDNAKELWVNSILTSDKNYNISLTKEIKHKIDIYHELHGSNAIYPLPKSYLPELFDSINYYQ